MVDISREDLSALLFAQIKPAVISFLTNRDVSIYLSTIEQQTVT